MLESSHAWLGASTSSLAADSYQYQLQSMWQKCWNTNQSLVHNLRFRERGPLKSWRPETMAEAILSVLKEGLSLSQAARKYDIPYPTFVLYANRVHNMLGPSADGGSDLRPKGRGRPQRILLGIWPEDHIRGVIRAVVFRDPQHMKEETLNLGYPHRMPKSQLCTPESVHSYGSGGGSGGGGSSGPGSVTDSVSPNSAAAAVVAVAQNLRQQMLAAAHHHEQHPHQYGGFLAAAAAAHCGNGAASLMLHSPSPVDSSPRSSPLTQPNNNMEPQPMVYKPMPNDLSARADHLFQDDMDLMKRPQQPEPPKVKVGIGVSGMPYKGSCEGYGPPRPDSLLQDEFENLVKSPPQAGQPMQKEPIHMSVDQRTD
ncbi:unnamed protein product [Nezara viridula]|uniref:HTH psq-type domain-containing protein n=1 Tax=Nezara viridula TaxID=85310 RepID=A0A9P0E8R4_NEZVI|nr:unnamed protein product [Nezara viridula]